MPPEIPHPLKTLVLQGFELCKPYFLLCSGNASQSLTERRRWPGQLCCELVIKLATNLANVGENSFSFNEINKIRSLFRPVASLHHLCPLIVIQISSFVPTVGKLSFHRPVRGPQNPNVFSLSTQILVHHIFPVAHGHF